MGCDVSLHICQKQQQRCSGGETGREPEHIQVLLPETNPAWAIASVLANAFICSQPVLGTYLVFGEPPKHVGPQGISTAKQKPRQAKDQLGLSKGKWGPTRQQGLEKTELHWADMQLLSLGVMWVAQLIIPQNGCILLAGTELVQPGTVLHSLTEDPESLKMPLGDLCHPSLGSLNSSDGSELC